MLQLSGAVPLSRESLTVDSLLAMDPIPGEGGAAGGAGGGGGGLKERPSARLEVGLTGFTVQV